MPRPSSSQRSGSQRSGRRASSTGVGGPIRAIGLFVGGGVVALVAGLFLGWIPNPGIGWLVAGGSWTRETTAPRGAVATWTPAPAAPTVRATISPARTPTAASRAGVTPTPAPAAPTARPTGTAAATTPIQVYFSRHPQSDDDFSAVFPVARSASTQAVAHAALRHLVDGPTQAERSAGFYSELGGALSGQSSCGGSDFQVAIRDGLATVRFCRAASSAGIGQSARIQSQIERTIRQFATVREVRLLNSAGRCLFDESGLDPCLSGRPSIVPRTAPFD